MHPINLKTSSPSTQAATDQHVGNSIPTQANPIASQAQCLNSEPASEKKDRYIQSASSQTSPRASEKKLPNDDWTRIENALNIQNTTERDEALLKIAQDNDTSYYAFQDAIKALSTQEKKDQFWIARAKNKNLDTYDRVKAAQLISKANSSTKDAMLLEIAQESNIRYSELEDAIKALSTQEKKDQFWIARAKNQHLDAYDRVKAAQLISEANSSTKDAMLLEIAQESDIEEYDLKAAIEALSTEDKRDQACIARAKNQHLDAYDRIEATKGISSDNNSKKDEILFEIVQESDIDKYELEAAIKALSNDEKRDHCLIARAENQHLDADDRIEAATLISKAKSSTKDAILLKIAEFTNLPICYDALNALSNDEKHDHFWMARARNKNLATLDRIYEAKYISAANTILRNTVLIELYNEELSRGAEITDLERIIQAIQDQALQALAREALAAGEMVILTPTKSARKG
jgi:predicted nucleic acid-binding protein